MMDNLMVMVMLETIEQYISPELLVLIPVLYLIGASLKRYQGFADKHIPVVLGIVGIVLAMVYEFSVMGVSWEALYVSAIQGILCAGASVYVNQTIKQVAKDE